MLQYALDDGAQEALVAEGVLTTEQLTKAREIHRRCGGNSSLSEVMLESQRLRRSRLEEFVKRHGPKSSLSDILIAKRLVTEHDVLAAREVQRKSSPRSKRIGETLVEMGLIEERH